MLSLFCALPVVMQAAPAQTPAGAYAFSFPALDGGGDIHLRDYAGKVMLIVNTASQCGFAGQYRGLEALYQSYRARGFVVIGVPCNDFGGQEPGDAATIRDVVTRDYGITFPMTGKISVRGAAAHPFFLWAAGQGEGGLFGSGPKWNFHKYLIDRTGQIAGRFGSTFDPDGPELRAAIEKLLVDHTKPHVPSVAR